MEIATFFTAIEGLRAISPRTNFDPVDVGLYYGTALFAYGVDKIINHYKKHKND